LELEVEGDVAKAVAGAASALAGGAAELLGMLAIGGGAGGKGGGAPAHARGNSSEARAGAAAAAAGEAAQQAFFFGDWRATLAASGVDLRGWLLTRRPRLADVYDALYRDDLVATFRETFAEEDG